MKPFEAKDYKIFDMFNNQWALATAGGMDHWNTCTIAWGSLGTIWGGPGGGRSIATIYTRSSAPLDVRRRDHGSGG